MDLNEPQKKAVEHPGGPLLIAAGAGSGKTRALTQRLKTIIDRGTPPHEVIAITFTNKAAKEMRRRVFGPSAESEKWSPVFPVYGRPFIGTFHALGSRLLRQEIDSFTGRNKSYSIFDTDNSLSLIKKILKDMNLPKERINPRMALSKISEIKSELENAEALIDSSYWLDQLVSEIYKRYEDALHKHNAFDFDDLIHKPVFLLQSNKGVLEKYQKLFSHILVDEYQDINAAQYQLVRLLSAKHQNITVVGDDAQAIYSFRGADFRNFLNFKRDWPEATIVKLEQNYRSTNNIISAASAVIANNRVQTPKTLWTEVEDGAPVHIVAAQDSDIEATWVGQEILNIEERDANGDVVVLYRTNAQSRAIEQALISENIPYRIYGGLKFYDRKEVKDVLSALRFISNPQDATAMERLQKSFGKRLGAQIEEKISQLTKETPVIELMQAFLSASGYTEFLERKFDNPQERLENIAELLAFAGQFSNLEEFLERVSLLEATDDANAKEVGAKKMVTLMTIHMAKGLEFDYVFLVGCNEGTLPHEKSMAKEDDIEEERRLMYVAMTRARKELYVLFHSFASRFVYEIPKERADFISPTGMWREMPTEEDAWLE